MTKKISAILMFALMGALLAACGSQPATSADTGEAETSLPLIDSSSWQYDKKDDVYYQLGVRYCTAPADARCGMLDIFVPGAYMDGTANGDGTYTCTVNTSGAVGEYTAQTAPIALPVKSLDSAMAPPTLYTSYPDYMERGFIYVNAGCRGKDSGRAAQVADLKAAVRYLRYTASSIPGNTDSIFAADPQDKELLAELTEPSDGDGYDALLREMGAVMGVSDAITATAS